MAVSIRELDMVQKALVSEITAADKKEMIEEIEEKMGTEKAKTNGRRRRRHSNLQEVLLGARHVHKPTRSTYHSCHQRERLRMDGAATGWIVGGA